MYVMVHNIDYHLGEDGRKIVEAHKRFRHFRPQYRYVIGQSGAYGNFGEYDIPVDQVKQFTKDLTALYRSLQKEMPKLRFFITGKERFAYSRIGLLDMEPHAV